MSDQDNILLSIIIINWNSRAYLAACLKTVFEDRVDFPMEVLVIDNASYDGSEAMVAEAFPAVRFIQSEENLGFARANNRAAEQARGEFLFFLNPDTEVYPGALQRLCDTLGALPGAGILGGKLRNSDGSIQTTSTHAFPTLLNQALDIEFLRKRFSHWKLFGIRWLFEEQHEARPVEVISGADLMIRREVFHEVGGFSTDYFMYAEDFDLCYKVHQAGYGVFYEGRAEIKHHGGGSANTSDVSFFSAVMTRESVNKFIRR
ncbi:MAG TPA: glycosyltransferase family 2 protein, partial [Calditrichia bacterium]|nr:glycosyltransferase family 2 protein [Calditrichia bacterium]